MAIPKGHRFPIDFDEAFPQGLVMVGEIVPDTEYQSREDKASGRPVRQRTDEVSGARQWRLSVTDPGETNAKRASFSVTLLSEVAPVPTSAEVLPGIRPIALDGLTAEPRLSGTGEFKYQAYAFRASRFRAVDAGTGQGSGNGKAVSGAGSSGSGSSAAKAA
ncbi:MULTISPECIES: hypothetical protein [Actinoalloteichus]|uniref:Plasmid replication, integration and excision activator n=1 Tax=Actinoalloteichus fjordicus TaxID=1612552 RepID=A0AAC9L9U1_9PSEU|nr:MULTISPECIES: hypothetical protein [Actinoalloteichus]APU12434.1 hypothetical protein UA74_01730 [Actinoalloteichus fjordicus]APU18387.1 hypothetical protein UA75_01735 [Actinoalloteichus sp. GBA129-24]